MFRFFVFSFAIFLPFLGYTQLSGRVFDAQTKVPMAFVTIVPSQQQSGTYTDIDGKFELPEGMIHNASSVQFSFVGYEAKSVSVQTLREGNGLVYLSRTSVSLQEAVILPGVNPADLLMEKVIRSKKQNNPEMNGPFTYDAYNKLVFTTLLDSSMTSPTAEVDSSDQEMIDFFESQHLFMMESISERRFISEGKETEIVKASKVSGLSTPDFALLSSQLQSFSFYQDEVALLEIRYLSPLHSSATNKYLFIIEDTTYAAMDTVFVLSYRPKSKKNFKGLKGLLYINSDGYALQNVLAEPADDKEDVGVKIRQRYEKIDDQQWFPTELNTDLVFGNVDVGSMNMVGIGRSYINNINLEPELKRRDVGEIALRMEEAGNVKPESYWNQYRNDSLDQKELKTYTFMDSLSKEMGFDRKYKWFQALSSGNLKLGKIDFDLTKVLRFNTYEGFRLGGGLYTNDDFIRNVRAGGYMAYGFGDRDWKGEASIDVTLSRMSETRIGVYFHSDVHERGGVHFPAEAGGLSDRMYYQLYVDQMDRREGFGMRFSSRLPGYLKMDLDYFNGDMLFNGDYRWFEEQNDALAILTEVTALEEVSVDLSWSYREQMIQTKNRRISVDRKFPLVGLSVTAGNTNGDQTVDYQRWVGSVYHTFKTALMGDLRVMVHGGVLEGNAPLSHWFGLRGAADQFAVFAPLAFENLESNRVYHDRYFAAHFRHNFKDIFFSRPNFKPHLVLVHNFAIGEQSDDIALQRNIETREVTAGFFESGVEIQNLLVSGFSGLGVAGYYRHGAYNTGDLSEDLMLKFTATFSF